MKTSIKLWYIAAVMLAGVGCGAGGGGTNNGDGVPVAKSFYHFYLGTQNQLFAVDPLQPTAGPTEIRVNNASLNITKYQWIRSAQFSNDTLSDIHYPWLVVFDETDTVGHKGTLYKIDTLPDGKSPAAIQLSQLTNIAICAQDSVVDFTDRAKSMYFFRQLLNGDCTPTNPDTAWWGVSMAADANTSPMAANKLIEGIRSDTGAITGYLVKKKPSQALPGSLMLVDRQFSSVTVLLDNNGNTIPLGVPVKMSPNVNGVYLFSTDNTGTAKLFGFDTVTNNLTNGGAPLYTFGSFFTVGGNDRNFRYFDDGNGIFRVARDGATVAQRLVSDIQGSVPAVKKIALTDNYLVYRNSAGNLYRVSKGGIEVAESNLTPVATGVAEFYTAGAWIFYTTATPIDGVTTGTAHYVREDGSTYGKFDGKYSSNPTNVIGAFWVNNLLHNSRSDEEPNAKGDMVLFMAMSDSASGFYRVTPGSSMAGAPALTLSSTVDVAGGAISGDNFEGDYALVAVVGASGEVYTINVSKGTAVRVDDKTASSGDEASVVLGLQ